MTDGGKESGRKWPPAKRWALVTVIGALLLLPASPLLSAALIGAYILACGLDPFFPRWSWYLPVVSRGPRDTRAVALTFDDGPDPAATPALLALLDRHAVKATFFLLGRRAADHPDLVDAIIDAGHTVGNHSFSHDPALMLRASRRLEADILALQDLLAGHGVRPLAFRPPVGITNPLLNTVLNRLGLYAVNFSCRGYDLGNRRLAGLAAKMLARVRPGDILLLHDTAPPRAADLAVWLGEVETLLKGLRKKGLAVLPLAALIGREVMVHLEPAADGAGDASASASTQRQQRGSEAR